MFLAVEETSGLDVKKRLGKVGASSKLGYNQSRKLCGNLSLLGTSSLSFD